MSLPNQIDKSTPAGSAAPSTLDDKIRELKVALEDLLGIPDATNISNKLLTVVAAGLQTIHLQDASGSPTATGEVQLNGTELEHHDGTAARKLYQQSGTDVAVADGGTGLSSGTSGGVLAFTGSTTLASSAALTANGLVYGGGAGAAPAALSAATNGQIPIGNTGSAPTLAVPTGGAGITVTGGSGSLTIAWTVFVSSEQVITTGGSLTIAHGLGAIPTLVQARLVCQSAEEGYSVGDELIVNNLLNSTGGGNDGQALMLDATNINIRFGNASPVYDILNFSTGNAVSITNANWRLKVYAWV